MRVAMSHIPKDEFYSLRLPVVFNDKSTSRSFGVIAIAGKPCFKMAWQSDLVEPVITEIRNDVVSIGIDQNLAIVNFTTNAILLNVELTYNFLTTEVLNERILMATELEVLEINSTSFEILHTYLLPDLFEEFVFENGTAEVRCAGNIVVNI